MSYYTKVGNLAAIGWCSAGVGLLGQCSAGSQPPSHAFHSQSIITGLIFMIAGAVTTGIAYTEITPPNYDVSDRSLY